MSDLRERLDRIPNWYIATVCVVAALSNIGALVRPDSVSRYVGSVLLVVAVVGGFVLSSRTED
ncbi:hypothetical protein [Haloarchaeobius sp. DFWS5]|uniref:hypothetical protein n=1 Tax=Haloarchaeobius sp. DFWS5 TaxID=3446114 RepID=UPI003EBACFF0